MGMKVFKFGGASVKSAEAVQNVASVINHFPNESLVVVISAMGKTTNAFEELLNSWYHNPSETDELLAGSIKFHSEILENLFPNKEHDIYKEVSFIFETVRSMLSSPTSGNYDFDYDQLVSNGELLSTKIVAHYLQDQGLSVRWLDARQLIRTDNTFREGKIDWNRSQELILENTSESNGVSIFVTQGFIGSNKDGNTTTLGREGSDFSASIIGYCIDAESVTIWKDVPGVLNADPKWFDNTVKLEKISYHEATELSYYGATIIHPKTIKPLENKKIPLYAKSFVEPQKEGTVIQENRESDDLIPSFIFKVNQVLISISPKDFSFIAEDNLERIFKSFADHRVRINLMQNSALNFSVCVNMNEQKIPSLIESLQEEFSVRYNNDVELVTIRHYDEATIERVTLDKSILIDQRTRQTARMVIRNA